jgi:hypothetical protein
VPLTGNSATVAVAVGLAGQNQLRLVVTDGGDGNAFDHADWGSARFLCGTVNNPPTPTITSPTAGTLFRVGDVISFSGSATDTESGTLPPGSLEWIVTLQHCPGADCHTHPFTHTVGAGGSFTVPDHGDNSFFEITLWATDSGGATGTVTRTLNPQTSQVTFNSSPSGLQVVYGSTSRTTPFTVTSIVGSTQTISATSPQGSNVFTSWSDGGAQQHNITIGASNTTLTAIFNGGTGPTTTYVSDLTPTSATNGWGPVERDRSNGDLGAADGLTLTLNGTTFAKGLGAHAFSDVQYALGGSCSTFNATVGVDDEVGTLGSVVFQVFVDGVLRFDSGTMTGTTASRLVSVSLAGATQLRLVVTDGGDGPNYDHADWADARVTCTTSSGSSTTYVSDLTPTSAANGWGPVERDRSNGDLGAADGLTLTLNGVTFAKGLGVHALSDVSYALSGSCSTRTFNATVGVDDEVGSLGSVIFQVFVDNVLRFDSGTMTGTTASRLVSVSLAGATQLRLVVTDGGDDPYHDHADWADARVVCTP